MVNALRILLRQSKIKTMVCWRSLRKSKPALQAESTWKAWIQSLSDAYFAALALVGGSYLLWIAYRLWTQPARFTGGDNQPHLSASALLILGYVTAVVNPKGWGFMIALLPGFMSVEYSTPQQLAAFLGVMLPSEFLSMTLYAAGGSGLRRLLTKEQNLANLNKVAAGLMVLVAALMLFRI